jgi:PPK2 family polyphosphate:nucleotide phosphotransferase
MNTEQYRIVPRQRVTLKDIDPRDDGGLDKPAGERMFAELFERMADLQELLYAEGKHALLIVLQAMDAGGKDSTIREVFGAFNPAGCQVHSFKAPTEVERGHDFLWRIHQRVPQTGYVSIFNRSHYEDVLIVRVKKLVPKDRWEPRYDAINGFEQFLHREGTTILKFFLHISQEYQKERLLRRLAKPAKHWKFNPADLVERERWSEYQQAYEDALERCSSPHAPWYVVPAERQWFRNLLIAKVVVETLESLKMQYPQPTFDPSTIVIPD